MDSSKVTAVVGLPSIVWYVLIVIGSMKMFEKAGKSPILAIIPIVNFFVLVDAVTNGKRYKALWIIVPIADIVFLIKFSIKTAKCYGYGTGFGILSIFFRIFARLLRVFLISSFIIRKTDNSKNLSKNLSRQTAKFFGCLLFCAYRLSVF